MAEIIANILQFERNVSFFGIFGNTTIKKEIDITIFTPGKKECYAVELKYPRNGQYPEQMYAFTKDILFMEQLREHGFIQTCAVTLVEDRPFYAGDQKTGIYQYFRCGMSTTGSIYKPTGSTKGKEHIDISGSYTVRWQNLMKNADTMSSRDNCYETNMGKYCKTDLIRDR